MPAVGGALAKLVVDSRLNKWVAHEADNLVALPDATRWPLATAFVLLQHGQTPASLGSARGRLLRLFGARLVALGSSALPGGTSGSLRAQPSPLRLGYPNYATRLSKATDTSVFGHQAAQLC